MLTMTTSCQTKGISPENLHWLRYQYVVNREGQKILCKVFDWSYLGGNISIKDYLFSTPDFSNTQFKKIFNTHQQTKLNAGDPVTSFDISLLYVLFQHVCDLEKDIQSWTKEETAGPSLENLIYKVKQHRNHLAHESQQMTEEQLHLKLDELKQLYKSIITKAASNFSKPLEEINQLINTINENFDEVCKKIREPLGPEDTAQYQQEVKELREQLKSDIEQVAIKEVKQLYLDACDIDPVPWLLMDCQVKPTQIFTKFLMNEEITSKNLGREEQPKEIPYDEIFRVRRDDGSLPKVLILTGEGGMGKTTFLKFLTEVWINNPKAVSGLDKTELLINVECRHPTISTFDQLLKHILHDTPRSINVEFEHIKDTILHMQLLILVDGFDEVNHASGCLIQELLSLPGENIRIIFTTRPSSTSALAKLVPHSKRRINLVLRGITQDNHQQFVEQLYYSLEGEERYSHIKGQLKDHLSFLQQQLGMHLNNPLTLTLMTFLYVLDPNRVNFLTTATELYEELRKMITDKLVMRLSKSFIESELDFKCYQFLDYSDELSYRAMKRQEYELYEETVENLKQKCRDLGLPHEEVLSAYFTTRRSRQGLRIVLYFTYHHLRLQEFATAKYLLKKLTHSAETENTVKHFVKETEEWKIEKRFQNVLIHLTGLLAKSYKDILAIYATSILELVSLNSTNIDTVLAHVTESKDNEDIVRAAAAKLDAHSRDGKGWWEINEGNNFCAIPSVLNHTKEYPELVMLSIDFYGTMHPQLALAFSSLSKQSTRLVLDIPQLYFNTNLCYADDVVTKLSGSGGLCRLVGFRGPLSPAALLNLTDTVEELRLRIDANGLQALNFRLPSLSQLSILGVRYDDEKRIDPSTLPILKFTGRDLCFTFNPNITEKESDLDWACGVLARLCSGRNLRTCTSILFRHTQLTASGCEKLLMGLHQQGVRIKKRIDIYIPHRFEHDNYKHLKNQSRSLNLGDLLLHLSEG
ncbi:uncharacterized protein LOC121876398 [Homarus americanus]|uniref:Putative NACHT domain and DZIP3/ hRUL138-like HEPN-containing protein 1 n=1 Tax=Homarus americanus TaxID=6706 RepID=A0A8J5JL78_HOMAM|nr:uncharacterized protein LOC121876398 [Homarus americanus]XP_042237408.1 uncharacterized protein LOC121876398 [Homarus americanus]KAG7160322.1 putative NACHT domain and DZIP3/ hRUL138-like HEPN-containing protein 1 [Homarus americanus]